MELLLLGPFMGVALWLLFGIFSGYIASQRGRSGLAWFLVGAFFGPFGLLVAAVPAKPRTGGDRAPSPYGEPTNRSGVGTLARVMVGIFVVIAGIAAATTSSFLSRDKTPSLGSNDSVRRVEPVADSAVPVPRSDGAQPRQPASTPTVTAQQFTPGNPLIVSTARANIRSSANTRSRVVRKVDRGDTLRTEDDYAGAIWFRLGGGGFVHESVVTWPGRVSRRKTPSPSRIIGESSWAHPMIWRNVEVRLRHRVTDRTLRKISQRARSDMPRHGHFVEFYLPGMVVGDSAPWATVRMTPSGDVSLRVDGTGVAGDQGQDRSSEPWEAQETRTRVGSWVDMATGQGVSILFDADSTLMVLSSADGSKESIGADGIAERGGTAYVPVGSTRTGTRYVLYSDGRLEKRSGDRHVADYTNVLLLRDPGDYKSGLAPASDMVAAGSGARRDQAPTRSGASAGEQARLRNGMSRVFVAASKPAFEALSKAANANDTYGIDQLIASGALFPVADGAKVLVLDRGFFKTQVRVVSGAHAGRSGWVAAEWVVR